MSEFSSNIQRKWYIVTSCLKYLLRLKSIRALLVAIGLLPVLAVWKPEAVPAATILVMFAAAIVALGLNTPAAKYPEIVLSRKDLALLILQLIVGYVIILLLFVLAIQSSPAVTILTLIIAGVINVIAKPTNDVRTTKAG